MNREDEKAQRWQEVRQRQHTMKHGEVQPSITFQSSVVGTGFSLSSPPYSPTHTLILSTPSLPYFISLHSLPMQSSHVLMLASVCNLWVVLSLFLSLSHPYCSDIKERILFLSISLICLFIHSIFSGWDSFLPAFILWSFLIKAKIVTSRILG